MYSGRLFIVIRVLPLGCELFSTAVCTGQECDGWYDCDRSFSADDRKMEISALGTLADPRGELLDVIEHLTPMGHFTANLLLRVHDRGVITAECLPDLGQ